MTASALLHPGLWLAGAGIAACFLRGGARRALLLAAPLAALALLWAMPEGAAGRWDFVGFEATLMRVDPLARLFATIFAVAAFAGALFAMRQGSRVEVPAAFVYAGSAIGATLAGDLVTLFVFWELMAIGSTLVLWSAGPAAYPAAARYVALHLLGGVLLMAGIAGHAAATGTIAFDAMRPDTAATVLILAGFLLNAAAPPLWAWVADAYPEASWSGTVFLSVFTTKTAVYALLRGFAGTEILVPLGLVMAIYGIVWALRENDMRRMLAYVLVSQVGLMVAGAGIGSEMAVNGVAAAAVAHILYKALLLMSAGSVLRQTGRRRCTELGGLFRSMPVTTACAIAGALSTSAPLTCGFVSKAMLAQAAADGGLAVTWLLLMAASVGAFLVAGLRYPWLVFFGKDSGLRPADPPASMRAAMLLLASLCIATGVAPGALYSMLPHPVDYVPYTAGHVVGQLQLMLGAGLAFMALLRWLAPAPTVTLDLDWLYRRAAPAIVAVVEAGIAAARRVVVTATLGALHSLFAAFARLGGPGGRLGATWAARTTVMIVLALLLVVLLLSFR